MKRRIWGKILSMTLSLMLVLSLVAMPDTVSAEGDTEAYAYYGANGGIKAAYDLNSHYQVEDVTSQDEEGVEVTSKKYTRTSVNADGNGYGYSSQVYFGIHDQFKLTFKAKFSDNAEQYLNVTYGEKEIGDSRAETGAATVKFSFGVNDGKNKLQIQSQDGGWFWGDNSGDNKWYNTQYVDFNSEEEHTYSIEVKDNILTIRIDNGYMNRCMVNALYGNGGYVSIGANRAGLYFYDVKIEDLEQSDKEMVYPRNANGSASIKSDPVSVDTYYEVATDEKGNKSYTRNAKAVSGTWVAGAFLTLGNYKNFRLEFDFEYPSVNNEKVMWINIGNLRENGVTSQYGSKLLGLRSNNTDSYLELGSGKSGWAATYNVSKINYRGGRLKTNSELSGHIIVTVKDNLLTVQHGESIMNYELTDPYYGGFVQLGVNMAGVKFSNIEIEELAGVVTPFTTYYTDCLGAYQKIAYSGSSNDGALTEVPADQDWSYDGNTLTYKRDASGNAFNKKMSVAYLQKQTYEEFEMSFEYRAQWGDAVYVGFGAEMGKSWMADTRVSGERKWQPDASNHVVMLRPAGWASFAPGSSYVAGTDSNDNWYFDGGSFNAEGSLFSSAEEMGSFHKATIRVENGKAMLVIDGKVQGIRQLRDGYQGGYIYFASNNYGASFRNIQVTALSEDDSQTYDIEGFTAYYSDKISSNDSDNQALTKVPASKYWSYDSETKTVRRSITANAVENDGNADVSPYKTEWSQLTYNIKMGDNFSVECDVTYGYDAWNRAYIGIGGENMNAVFMQEDGGIASHLYPDFSTHRTRINLAGNLWSDKRYAYEWRTVRDDVFNNRTNHVKIVVQNRLINYYANDELMTQWAFPEWYKGGYVYFGSNSSGASFSNIKINGIDAMETVKDKVLSGKSALFVGDSISVGNSDCAMAYAWGGRIGRKYGMDWVNNSQGGITLARNDSNSVLTKIEAPQIQEKNFDYVIMEGGVNDALKKVSVGEISSSYDKKDFDTTTMAGALEYAFATVTERWPEAHIGFIVTFQTTWIGKSGTSPYYNVVRTICQKWNVPYLDLNGETVKGVLKVGDETDSYLADGIHPNADGYELLVDNYIENWMLNLKQWGGLKNYARGDFDRSGQTDEADIAAIRRYLVTGEYDECDFSEPDIMGDYASLTPDLNGDTGFDVLDLIRIKKIEAEGFGL